MVEQEAQIVSCPFCMGEIHPAAKKCKHCGEWVHPESKGQSETATVIAPICPPKNEMPREYSWLQLNSHKLWLGASCASILLALEEFIAWEYKKTSYGSDLPSGLGDRFFEHDMPNAALIEWTTVLVLGGLAIFFFLVFTKKRQEQQILKAETKAIF